MNASTLARIKEKYRLLADACAELVSGSISSADMKKATAPLGIYEQKNGNFMMRIRVAGGELSMKKLDAIVSISKEHGIRHLHITTRQDIQLHDVESASISSIAEEFLLAKMPFYGGGADTFRNITACPHGGFAKESVFDTVPYAKTLSEYLIDYEKAFELPRKFKISFSCCPDDYSMAKFNDLGFIAKIARGRRGFEVYAGGGMGKESYPGIRIFDFISENELFRIAIAIINLFHEHGNRVDRSRARLRFVPLEKGEDFFRDQISKHLVLTSGIPSFESISKKCSRGKVITRLFIPNGNLTADEFAKIAEASKKAGAKFLRLSQEQDIFAGPIDSRSEKKLKNSLSKFSGKKIEGLVKSCVGSKVCKIGFLDAMSHAREVSLKLDKIISEVPDDKRVELIELISSMIKISGCPNSCGLNRAAKFGFQGMKKNIAGTIREFYIFQVDASKQAGIMSKNSGHEIPVEDLPDFISNLILKEMENRNLK